MNVIQSIFSSIVTAAIVCSVPTSTAAAPAGSDAGLVVDYAPSRASHVIIHRGSTTETPIRLGTVVQANDLLKLRVAGHVTIQLWDGTQKEIEGPGEWRVPEGQRPGAIVLYLHSLAGLLGKQADIAASAVSRGPEDCDSKQASAPIRVPILREHSRVSAGTQTLAIGWFGGCPPYSVSLSSGAAVAGHAEGLTKRQQTFRELNLEPGAYTLRIQDGFGTSATYALEVVAAGPTVPGELAADRTSADVIARSVWLSELEGGAWRLESVKTLRPLFARKDKIAARLADYLLSSSDTPTAPSPTMTKGPQ